MVTKNTLQTIVNFGIVSIIITLPISFTVGLFSPNDPSHAIIGARFSIADIILGIITIIWISKIIIYREYKTIQIPPTPIISLFFFTILSGFNAISINDWIKEEIQMFEYFIIFYMLLINNKLSPKYLKILVNLIFVSATIIIVIALYQNYILVGSPYLIRSVFEDRNILGGYLALILPLLYNDILNNNNLKRKLWLFLTICLSFLIIHSIEALLAIVIAFTIMTFLDKSKKAINFGLFLLIGLVICVLFIPERNRKSINDFASIYEQGDINKNFYRVQTILYNQQKDILYDKIIGKKRLVFTSDIFKSSVLPRLYLKDKRYESMVGETHIKQRYIEWQAALNMINSYPLLGVGAGNYQNNIGFYYKELPKVNTAEPNWQNGFLVLASSIGFLGLSAFIWIILSAFKGIIYYRKSYEDTYYKYLSLGLYGSLIAGCIFNVFSSLFVSGLLGIFIWLLSYCSTNTVKQKKLKKLLDYSSNGQT